MLLGLVSHFQFVGGYLGVTAIALYCLLGLWAIWMWRQQPRYQLFAIKKQFVSLGLAVFCFELLPGQALHAKTLGFEHPVSGEYLRFDSVLPQGYETVLNKWRTYTQSNE